MATTEKKLLKGLAWALLVFCTLILLRSCFLYAYFYFPDRDYFGDDYRQILSPVGVGDYLAARGVLKEAEAAFSSITTAELAEERFGALKRFCVTDVDAVSEKHSLDLVSARFSGDSGYLWVSYWQAAYDQNRELTSASGSRGFGGRILSRWELTKDESGWEVLSIREHP